MKWRDIFQDPDMVGQTEYLAIYDAVATSVLGTENPDPDRELTEKERRLIKDMLEEFRHVLDRLSASH